MVPVCNTLSWFVFVPSEAARTGLPAPDLLGPAVEERLFSRLDRADGPGQLPADGLQQVRFICQQRMFGKGRAL